MPLPPRGSLKKTIKDFFLIYKCAARYQMIAFNKFPRDRKETQHWLTDSTERRKLLQERCRRDRMEIWCSPASRAHKRLGILGRLELLERVKKGAESCKEEWESQMVHVIRKYCRLTNNWAKTVHRESWEVWTQWLEELSNSNQIKFLKYPPRGIQINRRVSGYLFISSLGSPAE